MTGREALEGRAGRTLLPPTLRARAWRGAPAAGEGRGCGGPGGGGPHLQGGSAPGQPGVPAVRTKRGAQAPGPDRARAQPPARPPAALLSRAFARPRPAGGDWPERSSPGRPRRGCVPLGAGPGAADPLPGARPHRAWQETPPRCGGSRPSARSSSAAGTTALSDG